MYSEGSEIINSKIALSDNSDAIKGIYIFKSDSGITLYSKKQVDLQEDFFSAFLSALKGFFSSLELGGLSSFASDQNFFYIASSNNVLTSIIVDINKRSDKYFSLAFEISKAFYKKFQQEVENKNAIIIPQLDQFDTILNQIIARYEDESAESDPQLLQLFKVENSGNLIPFSFSNEDQLYQTEIFLVVNAVTKQIIIVENPEIEVPSRKLFMAGKSASNMNQVAFKSEYHITNVSDEWGFERIIDMIIKLLQKDQ